MENQVDQNDAVRDLAMEGLSAADIQKTLEARGMAGHPGQSEIEAIVTEVRAGMNLVPQRPSRILARMIGVIAIVMGIVGLMIGTLDQFHVYRYSPGGYGLLTVILGAILVIRPSWSDENLS